MYLKLKFSDSSELFFVIDTNQLPWEELNEKFGAARLEELTIEEDAEGVEEKESKEVRDKNVALLCEVCKAIEAQNHYGFRSLSLLQCNLSSNATLVMLTKMIATNGKLEEFTMIFPTFGSHWDDANALILDGMVTAIGANPLKRLVVDGTGLDGPQMDRLGNSLAPLVKQASSVELTSLDQGESGNLTQALCQNLHLESLTLEAGADYLQTDLPLAIQNTSLRYLYLRCSDYADGVLESVAQALETNTTLNKLAITNYNLRDAHSLSQELTTLATAFDVNKTLLRFSFELAHDAFTDPESDGEEISDEDVESALDILQQALQRNLRFLEFEIDYTAHHSTREKIKQHLERNWKEVERQRILSLWLNTVQNALISNLTNQYLVQVVSNSTQLLPYLSISSTAAFFKNVQPNQSALASTTALSLPEREADEEKVNTGKNKGKRSFASMQSN